MLFLEIKLTLEMQRVSPTEQSEEGFPKREFENALSLSYDNIFAKSSWSPEMSGGFGFGFTS